jgi:hypothetical protein
MAELGAVSPWLVVGETPLAQNSVFLLDYMIAGSEHVEMMNDVEA